MMSQMGNGARTGQWNRACWEFNLTVAVSDCPHSSNAALNLLSLLRWGVLKRVSSCSLQHEVALNRANPQASKLNPQWVFVMLPETGGHSWAGFM